jgi:hypothetical protein
MIIASFFTILQLRMFFRESPALLTLHSFFLIAKKRRNTVFPASLYDALIVTTSLNTFIIHTTPAQKVNSYCFPVKKSIPNASLKF